MNVANKSTGSTPTLTIDIPVGLEIVSAPGVASISDGKFTTADYNSTQLSNYFDGTPSWTQDEDIDGVTTRSGDLVYTLSSSSAGTMEFSFVLKINPIYVQTGTESVANDKLGEIKASLKSSDDTIDESNVITVYTTSQAADLHFTALTFKEVVPSALSSRASSDSIMIDSSDSVILSATFAKNYAFAGSTYSMRATSISFDLTLPEDAKITETNSLYILGEPVSNDDDTETYSITTKEGNGANFSTSGTIDLSSFVTVQFPEGDFPSGFAPQMSVDNLQITIAKYNAENGSFENVDYTANGNGQTATVIVYDSSVFGTYKPTYSNSSSYVKSVLYYEGIGDQTLFTTQRIISSNGTGNTLNTWDDVKMEFVSVATGGDGAYLDNISQVVMAIPYLGDGTCPRYSSKLKSISIQYEGEETPTTLTLVSDITTYADNVVYYKDDNVTITYNISYPRFTFDFATGKNPIYICAEFDGDNITNLSGSKNYVYGQPKSNESTTTTSRYYFATSSYSNDAWSQISAVYGGFAWKPVTDFALTVENTSLTSQNYMYNTAKENTYISGSGYDTRLYGYHDLGSATLSNGTGSDTTDPVTIKIDGDDTNDVVKEIYFPLSKTGDLDQISSLSYQYVGEDTVYTYTSQSDIARYVVQSSYGDTANTIRVSSPPETFAVVQAPDGKELDYVSVTLSGWNVDTTASYAMLRGYIRDDTKLNDGGNHKLTITVGEQTPVSTTLNSTFTAPSTVYMGMDILNAVAGVEIASGTFKAAHTLTSGLSSVIEVDIMGGNNAGANTNPYAGSWHDITFTVVLPEDVELTDVTAYDWRYEYNGTRLPPVAFNM